MEINPKLETEPKYRKILNEISNLEKDINEEIFRNYFKFQNPSSLPKDFFKSGKKTIKSNL